MKKEIILTSLGLSLMHSGCVHFSGHTKSDEEISELLVGTWDTSPDEEELIFVEESGEKTYYSDGTADGFFKDELIGEFVYNSKWKVENGVLIIYDIEASPSTFEDGEPVFKPGEVIRDRILEINSEYYTYEVPEYETVETRRRKASNQSEDEQ